MIYNSDILSRVMDIRKLFTIDNDEILLQQRTVGIVDVSSIVGFGHGELVYVKTEDPLKLS